MGIIHLGIDCELLKCDRMADEFVVDINTKQTRYVCRRCINTLNMSKGDKDVLGATPVDLSNYRFKEERV